MTYEDIYVMKVYKITNAFIYCIHYIFCTNVSSIIYHHIYQKSIWLL